MSDNDDAAGSTPTADADSGRASRGQGDGGGCPFHDSAAGETATERGTESADEPGLARRAVNRRSFLRSALAIGGAGALAAVVGLGSSDDTDPIDAALDVPQGPSDPAAFPERQHAWNRDLATDPFGNGQKLRPALSMQDC
jgi:hypothetical protein